MKLALSFSAAAANFNSGHKLFILETFQVYLVLSLLYNKVLKILTKINIVLAGRHKIVWIDLP